MLLLLVVAGWLALVWSPREGWRFEGVEIASAPTGGDFRLDAPRGPLQLSDFRGQVVLLYFGYTWCPDICPTSLSLMTAALNLLSPAELQRVQPLFISVDPERDTLERLARYVAFFHPKILACTGDPERLRQVARQYGASYRRAEERIPGQYSVDHSADTYVIDAQGRLRRTLPHGTSAQELAAAIRALF
jgi:protein SCO1